MNDLPADPGFRALAATSCSVLMTDATLSDNPITYANEAFRALCGYEQAEIVGRNCRFLQGPDTDPFTVAEIRSAIADGKGIRRDILNYRKDGTPFWNELTIDPIRDPEGRLTGFVGIQHQVDTAHMLAEKRAEAESRLASIADHIPGYIYRRVMRTDGTIEVEYCSPSLCSLLGIENPNAAHSFYERVHPDDRESLLAAVRNSAADMSMYHEEFRLISASGVPHWIRSRAPPRRMVNGDIVWDGLAIEISGEKKWENEIATLALRDPLTGLLTHQAWRQAIALQLSAASAMGRRCGLLYIDVASFHEVNAQFGNRVGDDVLRVTAQRLGALAESVAGVAARLGGDEFAVLVPECMSSDALDQFARSSAAALDHPITAGAQSITIRTHMGASLYAERVRDDANENDVVAELEAQAELALRSAKRGGGSAPVLYAQDQDDRLQNEAILSASLQHAIENDELELHYQPLVDLTSGHIVSAEALVRWHHPTLGIQRPDVFISLAEKSGLIGPLGRWVFEKALCQWKIWHDAGLNPPPIAINVSGLQLMNPDFAAAVEQSLATAGGNARNFEFELTEGLLIESSPQILATLHALRRMGFKIAIDDFGSGHASFRYLRDFPVDKVKLDQLFVRKLVMGSADALIVRAVISLARSMGIAFVAEGIETQMHHDFLLSEGCQIGQGYLFSMPLVAEDFGWMLANEVSLPFAPAAGARQNEQAGT